jgi:hypothetical protein
MVFKRNKKTLKGGSKKLYKGSTKKNNTKRNKQKGGGFNIDASINKKRKEITKLQSQVKNILYDEYDWTKTFKPKTIDGTEYNHLLDLDNDELMTEKYYNLLYFVNSSITDFKSGSENVKMFLVNGLTDEDITELRKQEETYKAKYELENEEPIDLVEGLVRPRKDDTVYFEDLDDQFATMRDFLETRRTNLADCIRKEKDEKNNDTNKEYFEHEIASCSALLDKYDAIPDKTDKQALTEFVGEINDTLYYNKVFYELNKDFDKLTELIETYISNANQIDKDVLLSFIPIQFFNDNNDLKIIEFIEYLKTNPYQHQQFIYGIYELLYTNFNKSMFNSLNYMQKDDTKCSDFVYWSYNFNTYYMYLSTFSNNKVFPTKFILPYNYEYPNYDKFTRDIDKTNVKPELKKIIKEKDTFAFAISSYKSQMFIPSHINELEFIGCLMIKFNKLLKSSSKHVSRIWILFIFRNSNVYYESNVSGLNINFVMCNIQFYITENANITYRQLVSYKELKQYYYQSIKTDTNTNTQISVFKHNLEQLTANEQKKYIPFLFITRRDVNDAEFIELVKRANLLKYNLYLVGEKDKSFITEKYKYGLTGDIFYLELDNDYNNKLISS